MCRVGRKDVRVLYWVLAQKATDEGFCGRLHTISWPACSLSLGWVCFCVHIGELAVLVAGHATLVGWASPHVQAV